MYEEIGSQYAGMGIFAFMLTLSLILLFLVFVVFEKRKSKTYREVLADMYVASRIKQLAEEDKLDLVAEFESFKNWAKKRRLEEMSLDNAVEEDLKERVVDKDKIFK
jgi:hypothetical protein